MQRGDRARVGPSQLQPQQVGEQRLIAKPRAADVERGHERAGVVELLQDPLGPRAAGQGIGQRSADALEHRCAQQQVAHLGRLALEDLRQQIAPRSCARCPENSRDEALGIAGGRRARGRQPQAADPALAALVEQRPRRRPTARPRPRRAARASPRSRSAARRGRSSVKRTGESQPMQAEPMVRARAEHHAQLGPAAAPGSARAPARLGRLQLVQVVDDEHAGRLEPADRREQSLEHRLTAEARALRRCARATPRGRRARRARRSPTARTARPSRSSRRTVDQPACVEPGLGDPGAQQARLAARGRRGDRWSRRPRRQAARTARAGGRAGSSARRRRSGGAHRPRRARDQRHHGRAAVDVGVQRAVVRIDVDAVRVLEECAHSVPFVAGGEARATMSRLAARRRHSAGAAVWPGAPDTEMSGIAIPPAGRGRVIIGVSPVSVLVVDDDATFRRLARLVLAANGLVGRRRGGLGRRGALDRHAGEARRRAGRRRAARRRRLRARGRADRPAVAPARRRDLGACRQRLSRARSASSEPRRSCSRPICRERRSRHGSPPSSHRRRRAR